MKSIIFGDILPHQKMLKSALFAKAQSYFCLFFHGKSESADALKPSRLWSMSVDETSV